MDPQNLRLIANLTYDPGYILLLDYLQARLDDLTTNLSAPELKDAEALKALRYWQAFRDILHTLKVTPMNFKTVVDESEAIPDELPNSPANIAQIMAQSRQYQLESSE